MGSDATPFQLSESSLRESEAVETQGLHRFGIVLTRSRIRTNSHTSGHIQPDRNDTPSVHPLKHICSEAIVRKATRAKLTDIAIHSVLSKRSNRLFLLILVACEVYFS